MPTDAPPIAEEILLVNEPVFNSRLILDPAKAKCSMRSAIISSYQDKGFIIAGCTNLTEYELGFFVTFRRQFS